MSGLTFGSTLIQTRQNTTDEKSSFTIRRGFFAGDPVFRGYRLDQGVYSDAGDAQSDSFVLSKANVATSFTHRHH